MAAAGVVSGSVVDAATERPLADAAVTLEPLPAASADGSGHVPARTVHTDAAGRYRFAGLPDGAYRLHVRRMGFRAATLTVELRAPLSSSRLSVGLEVEAVALEPLEVRAPTSSLPPTTTDDDGVDLRAAVRRRQARYLATDVRMVAPAALQDFALGETDLLRALERLPGVVGRDPERVELWTRGAPWHQTQLLFDGVPVLDPTHEDGASSGFHADAFRMAALHPGARSASLPGGAAVLELRTRPGRPDSTRGTVDLSLQNLAVSADGPTPVVPGAWAVAGRVQFADVVQDALSLFTKTHPGRTHNHDLVARADLLPSSTVRLEIAGLRGQDDLWGADGEYDQSWTVDAGRIAAHVDAGPVVLTQEVQGSRTRNTADFSLRFFGLSWKHVESRWSRVALAGRVEPAAGTPWSVGYELARERANSAVDQYGGGRIRRSGLAHGAVWGETRLRPLPSLEVDAGLRVATGFGPTAPGPRVLPRLAGRLSAAEGTVLSAGYAESLQYLQVTTVNDDFETEDVLREPLEREHMLPMLADGSLPPIHHRVLSAGVERWLSDAWLVSANGYLRRSSGVALPDPTPGELTVDRSLVAGTGRAAGVELGVRRLAGRWTGAVAYTLARSRLEASGWRFSSPQDRRHTFKADLATLLPGRTRLAVSGSWAGGGAETRLIERECVTHGATWSTWFTGAPGRLRLGSSWTLGGAAARKISLFGMEGTAYLRLTESRAPTYHESSIGSCDWTLDHLEEVTLPDRIETVSARRGTVGLRIAF